MRVALLSRSIGNKMNTNTCFTCLNCGRVNPVKGHSYTNKYCNNSCQMQHRARTQLQKNVQEWKESKTPKSWPKIPEWAKKYLIEERGHMCQVCHNTEHNKHPIPLIVDYIDGDSYNNNEKNLQLICPNCRSLK